MQYLFVQGLRVREWQAVFRNGLRVVQKLIYHPPDISLRLHNIPKRIDNGTVLFHERRAVGRILSDGTEKFKYMEIDTKVAD